MEDERRHSYDSRLATIEQVLRDVLGDLGEIKNNRKEDHGRLRALETGVLAINQRQGETIARQERAAELLNVRLRVLSIVVACAGVVFPIVVVVVR